MGKNSFTSSFRLINRLPSGALGGIILFFLVQAVLLNLNCFWEYCYLFSDPGVDDYIRLEAQLHIARADTGKEYKILLPGSSQTREDFDVEYLDGRFKGQGVGFYNLGVSGASQPVWMYMIEDRIMSVKPDVIVCMLFVGSLYSDYDFSQMQYDFDPKILPYFWQSLDTKEIVDNKGNFIRSVAGQYLSVYKYKESLKRILTNYLQDEINGAHRLEPASYYYKDDYPPSYFEEGIKKAQGKQFYESGHTNLNKHLFRVFAEDIMKRGIKLIVLSGPTHPSIHECYNGELDIQFDDFLRRTAEDTGFTYIAKDSLPEFKEGDFIDFTHLNASGRNKLTEFLGDYMLDYKIITGDQWRNELIRWTAY